ncbi:MAG: ParA family protein [Terriglobia bacterium]
MGRIIAVANQKGGVGKTTTAINLAASLAAAEVQVVLVDCDPQANATASLGFHRNPSRTSLYHLLPRIPDLESQSHPPPLAVAAPSCASQSIDGAILPTCLEGLFLIPSDRNLAGADIELIALEAREFWLRDLLAPLKVDWPFIVLDCPPALNLLTVNALVAADSILIPMQCEYLSLEGVSALLDTVERIRETLNPGQEIEGVLLTMFDDRTTLARQVAEELRSHFKDKVFETIIPRNVRLAEAPSHGQPALLYDVRSRGAEAYIRLAKELMAKGVTQTVQ